MAVIGEAKAGRVGLDELARLRHVRRLLIDRGVADPATVFLLVGLEGVERAPGRPHGRGPDVVLLDAAGLYER